MYLFDQISEAGLSSLCVRRNIIFYRYDISDKYDKSYPITDSSKSDKVTANPTGSIVLLCFSFSPFLFCVTSGVTSLLANSMSLVKFCLFFLFVLSYLWSNIPLSKSGATSCKDQINFARVRPRDLRKVNSFGH